MNNPMDWRIKYIPQDHIFIAAITGEIDERKLAEIFEALRLRIASNLIPSKAIKFLYDFRKVQWDSETTHYKSREISRKYLREFRGYNYFFAILNDHREDQTLENEFFFTQKQKALEWLRRK